MTIFASDIKQGMRIRMTTNGKAFAGMDSGKVGGWSADPDDVIEVSAVKGTTVCYFVQRRGSDGAMFAATSASGSSTTEMTKALIRLNNGWGVIVDDGEKMRELAFFFGYKGPGPGMHRLNETGRAAPLPDPPASTGRSWDSLADE